MFLGGFALIGDVFDVRSHQAELRLRTLWHEFDGVVEVLDSVETFAGVVNQVGQAETGLRVVLIVLQTLLVALYAGLCPVE